MESPFAIGDDVRKVIVPSNREYSFQVTQGLLIANLCPALAEQIPMDVHKWWDIDGIAITRLGYHALYDMKQ